MEKLPAYQQVTVTSPVGCTMICAESWNNGSMTANVGICLVPTHTDIWPIKLQYWQCQPVPLKNTNVGGTFTAERYIQFQFLLLLVIAILTKWFEVVLCAKMIFYVHWHDLYELNLNVFEPLLEIDRNIGSNNHPDQALLRLSVSCSFFAGWR